MLRNFSSDLINDIGINLRLYSPGWYQQTVNQDVLFNHVYLFWKMPPLVYS
jgi:hypothetical protein